MRWCDQNNFSIFNNQWIPNFSSTDIHDTFKQGNEIDYPRLQTHLEIAVTSMVSSILQIKELVETSSLGDTQMMLKSIVGNMVGYIRQQTT